MKRDNEAVTRWIEGREGRNGGEAGNEGAEKAGAHGETDVETNNQVKFFERQKLGRIIKRAQRKVAEAEKEGKAKKTAKAEKTLADARVMLNYILNYP